MSDAEVTRALRSDARMVLVEAAAGCGKTYQGAMYAEDLVPTLSDGRLLILTHTNAACDVFAARTAGAGSRVEIRTIDSLIVQIATAYHSALNLPPEVAAWAQQQGGNGFDQVAARVADLMNRCPLIPAALGTRYPHVVCDEHQDASEAQHQIVLSILNADVRMRVFGDPMQSIYARQQAEREAWNQRWTALQRAADRHVELVTPHRWRAAGSRDLGDWIQGARNALKAGQPVDLRGALPQGVSVIRADNTAQGHDQYRLVPMERQPIDQVVAGVEQLLLLASTNPLVRSLRAFFYRRLPIWEGHTRYALSGLALNCQRHAGDPVAIANTLISFVQEIAVGFTDTGFGNTLRREIAEGCIARRREKPALIQELARLILAQPDHQGLGAALVLLRELIRTERAFSNIRLDQPREFMDAVALARHENMEEGLTELTLRRTMARVPMPSKAISTIHKAKGVECEHVLIMPCDRQRFGDTDAKRCLLYVALSRATKSVTLVVPNNGPSPLFRI